jgi:hypothetical protein
MPTAYLRIFDWPSMLGQLVEEIKTGGQKDVGWKQQMHQTCNA